MAQLVGRRYADALFNLAKETNSIDTYLEQVKCVQEVLAKTELDKIFTNPRMLAEEKLHIMENSFNDALDKNILGLFALVFRKNRDADINDILEAFVSKVEEFKGLSTAHVKSAVELTPEQIKSIEEKLTNKLKKQVTVVAEVDQTLIGGLWIKVDGYVVDSTIKNHIEAIRTLLLDLKLA